jgi:hypothetical protein
MANGLGWGDLKPLSLELPGYTESKASPVRDIFLVDAPIRWVGQTPQAIFGFSAAWVKTPSATGAILTTFGNTVKGRPLATADGGAIHDPAGTGGGETSV